MAFAAPKTTAAPAISFFMSSIKEFAPILRSSSKAKNLNRLESGSLWLKLKPVPVAIAEAALSFNSTERPSAEASATATLLAYFPEKSSSDEASDSKPPNFESNFCKIKFWNMELLSLTMSFSVTPTARMSPFHSSKSTSLAAMDIFGSPEQQSFEL
nr:hypothetical protein Iba_chr08bCG13570 [Ipomoea batatas]